MRYKRGDRIRDIINHRIYYVLSVRRELGNYGIGDSEWQLGQNHLGVTMDQRTVEEGSVLDFNGVEVVVSLID